MFFKTEADRASAQAAKARQDAGEAGSNAALGARNLGAAVLATLAEATAPADDRKGKKHAQRAKDKALKAAHKDREAAAKAAAKATGHGRKAAAHGRAAADKRADAAGGTLAALAGTATHKVAGAAGTAKVAGSQLTDKARSQATHVREVAAERSGPLADSARDRAAASAAVLAALAAAAREKAEETRARALLGVDHGIDVAVPRAQEGVAAVGPRVDHLRDVINNELLPKMQEMLADVQTSKERLLTEDKGAVAALTGTPKKRKRKGGALITLGLLTAAGAGIAWYLNQQQKNASDPWASQAGGADPWASRTPTSSSDPLGATASTTATATESTGTTVGAVGTGTTAGTVSGDGPRLLESEEIDALAADTPATAEEQTPGESPTEEIEQARTSSGSAPLATDVDAGEVDEGHDPQAPRV